MKRADIAQEKIHLEYIIDTVGQLEEFLSKADARKIYDQDWLIQAGVIRTMHTIAESTMHLSDEMKSRYSHIKWHQIKGFRNRLVHGYTGELDSDTVWLAATDYLPELRNVALKYYEEHYGRFN